MRHDYSITYGGVVLRPLTQNDALQMRILRNRNRHCFFNSEEISEVQQIAWYQRYLTKKDDYMFAISLRSASEVFCGAIGIYDFAVDGLSAESGRILIDKDISGTKGLGTTAITALCKLVFEQMNVDKVIAYILWDNIASVRAHEKAGYLYSGHDGACGKYEITKQRFALIHNNTEV